MKDFREFEHEGWERVAGVYQDVWAHLTKQFIDPLLALLEVVKGMRLLDVACGPGYVAGAALERGADPVGIDFSGTMAGIARKRLPQVKFLEGDAEHLPFPPSSFERVTVNFGMLHFPHPDRAIAEAHRVLVKGGRLGFTVWANGEHNPAARIMDEAVERYGKKEPDAPAGPPYYLYGSAGVQEDACRSGVFGEFIPVRDGDRKVEGAFRFVLVRGGKGREREDRCAPQ
jgi:ubiquinone/menaquinone biosynthesis C-methylase UbiE